MTQNEVFQQGLENMKRRGKKRQEIERRDCGKKEEIVDFPTIGQYKTQMMSEDQKNYAWNGHLHRAMDRLQYIPTHLSDVQYQMQNHHLGLQ
jgi:hypothetical protein